MEGRFPSLLTEHMSHEALVLVAVDIPTSLLVFTDVS